MPSDQRIGLRPAVGVEADQRLEQRGGELEGQGDQADLAEVELQESLRIG